MGSEIEYKELREKCDAKVEELSQSLAQTGQKPPKIKYFILTDGETEPCVIYYRTATTATKINVADIAATSGPYTAAKKLFDLCVIRTDSDPRVFLQNEDEDFFYMGALNKFISTVTAASDMLKKN